MDIIREKVINCKGNRYKVSFPVIEQFVNIETLKTILSKSQYMDMIRTLSLRSQMALDLVDCAATITVLIPDLITDLKVKNFMELDLADGLDIYEKVYKKQLKPWIDAWEETIMEKYKELNKEDKEEAAKKEAAKDTDE